MTESTIQVTVVFSPAAREVREITLTLPASSTVKQALDASGMLEILPTFDLADAAVGIWGRKTALNQTLRSNDRVEIYRALTVDPKVARRERFIKQGARTAGLFSRKRSGAKTGY